MERGKMEELKATKRDVLGKKNRFLRRQGFTPAHLFGHSLASLALQCDTVELRKVISHAGTTRLVSLKIEGDREAKAVFVREIQQDALTRQIMHVDFYQVRKGEKMTMDVPIILIGEAPAMKGKGRILNRGVTQLAIECLPEKVPPQIEVDISVLLEMDQAIHVKDIKLDPEIAVRTEPELLVAKVSEMVIRVEEEKKPVAEEAAAAGEAEAGAKAEAGAAKPEAGAAKSEAGAKAGTGTDKSGAEARTEKKAKPG
jgi:large subunit ribosomal protein L25